MNTKLFVEKLNELTSLIRKRELEKAKKLFFEIIDVDIELTKEIIFAIYDFGETFKTYKDPSFFLFEIEKRRRRPKKIHYLMKLEIIYNSYEDKKEVLKLCEKALNTFPNYPEFLNSKSNILSDLERYDEALLSINQALNLDKDNTMFLRNKALLLNEMNKKYEAIETIERALGFEPDNPRLLEDKEYIAIEGAFFENEEKLINMKIEMDKIWQELKNVRVEFVTIAGLFVVILTFVSKIITFDYTLLERMTYSQIFWYQLSVNSAWLFAIAGILIFVLFFNVRYKSKK